MPKNLEEQYSWPELCELTLGKLTDNLASEEHETFRKWFMDREKVGYRFDPILILRAFRIWQELENGFDSFLVCVGREGSGKSTIAVQLSEWVMPSTTNICYGAAGYNAILEKKANLITDLNNVKPESLILDEGNELLSRESMGITNRALVKTFNVQRALRFFIVVCIPNYFLLDSILRLHRVRTIIYILKRGNYKAITGDGIRIVNEVGWRLKDVNSVKLPDGTFWHGYFRKGFPNTINQADYEQQKLSGIRDLLSQLKSESSTRKMIQVAKVAKEMGCDARMLIERIKTGEIAGKMLANRWFMSIEAYQKLINV